MMTVSAEELKRLKKRFMKLDKDGSGSIDKDEFLQIPQIANNPLASRMIAIFDEESVLRRRRVARSLIEVISLAQRRGNGRLSGVCRGAQRVQQSRREGGETTLSVSRRRSLKIENVAHFLGYHFFRRQSRSRCTTWTGTDSFRMVNSFSCSR